MSDPLVDFPNRYHDWASFSPLKAVPKGSDIPHDWHACRALAKQAFARFLHLRDDQFGQVYIDHNATACLQRILTCVTSQVKRLDCALLTTDAEFPGIMSLLDEQWSGPVFVASVADLIARGEEGVEEVLLEAVSLVWPDVILISQVTREAGFRFTDKLFREIRRRCPEVVIIVDGAQACGNIFVSVGLLSDVDFYVTSGHKWLMGKPTIGFSYVRQAFSEIIVDPAQSYARCRGSGGTGDLSSLKTAAFYISALRDCHKPLLDEHAQLMIGEFLAELSDRGYKGKPIRWKDEKSHRTGIVTLTFPSGYRSRLHAKGTAIEGEAWRQIGEGLPPVSLRRYKVGYVPRRTALAVTEFNVSKEWSGAVCRDGTSAVRLSMHATHGSDDISRLLKLVRRRSPS